MECKFILSCQTDSEQLCLNEIKNISKDFKLLKWLDGGVGLAEHNTGFSEISKIFREEKPVFLRHIFPVEFIFNVSDCDKIIDIYKEKIDKNIAMSVQIRNKSAGSAYNLKEIKNYFVDCFESAGYLYNKSEPGIIISVFIDGGDNKIYAGMSESEENLSIWPGGMIRYALNDNVISRAEFKLLELFEYYPDLLKKTGTALDLGASPGGWTKILAEKGYKVTAVDPNKLDETFSDCPNVIYYKGLTEDFIKNINKSQKFDLIVNDMRMHIVQSARIMIEIQEYLRENGLAVITFKLNKSSKTAAIRDGLNILKEKYEILFMKQLFHNRHEITVVLGKKIFLRGIG